MAETKTPRKRPSDHKPKAASPKILSVGEDAERPEGIPLRLVRETYTVYPVKSVYSLKMANLGSAMREMRELDVDDDEQRFARIERMQQIVAQVLDWVDQVFSEEDAAKIHRRLDDSKDALDFPHIMEAMEAVQSAASEEETERPTS